MTNLERLQMEIKGITTTPEELEIYLMENDLTSTDVYDAKSNSNIKNILKTALAILESIANNTNNYKNYKTEDVTVSMFQKNLQDRIDYLNRKIRTMIDDDFTSENDATFIYMF